MNMHRRFSIDSPESLKKDSGSDLTGQKRYSKERRKSLNPQIPHLDIQELNRSNSLRSQIIEEEKYHLPDATVTKKNSFTKHSKTFHKVFQEIPAEEELTHVFTCSLQKEVLYHGKLYVSDNYVCFYSSMLLKDTKVMIHVSTVEQVKKQNAALSMLSIRTTGGDKYFFVSLRNRQVCYNTLLSVCRQTQQGGHVESGNSSPRLSSAENSTDAMGPDMDTISSHSSVGWSHPLELAGRETGKSNPSNNLDEQPRFTDGDSDDLWVWSITRRVKMLLGVMRKFNLLLIMYLFLLAVLLVSSGYISLRILALEKQLSSLRTLSEFSRPHRE